MKQIIPLLIILIGCSQSEQPNTTVRNGTIDAIEYSKFDNYAGSRHYFDNLEDIEISEKEKSELLAKIIDDYEYYLESEFYSETPLIKNFKFLELNNDGKPDMIYFGESGGEPYCTRIYISNEIGFNEPLVYYQYLKSLKLNDNKIVSASIVDPGCCASYMETETVYDFDDESEPEIKIIRTRIHGPISDEYEILSKPISFTIQSDFNRLRGEPMINDTGTYIYEHPNSGNTIAIFEKGDKGKVWAIDTSDSERDWWYVEMEPKIDSLSFDAFYFDPKKEVRRMGWMSNKYLEKE